MRLIQLNFYYNHNLHIFVLHYINYIVCVRAPKITKFSAYVLCVCTRENTVLISIII